MEILRRNIDAVHLLAGALFVALIGCDVPSDPNHTLNQVRVKAIRVGISDSPPWACAGPEGMAGIEVRLVREFAEQQDTEIEWFVAPRDELLAALEKFELDMVIGGLKRSSPWKKRLAFSRPYYRSSVVVLGPPRAPPVDSVEDRRVVVAPGTDVAALVRAKGGIPVAATEPGASELPRAVPNWRADTLGSTGYELKQDAHVLALPPGENRWLQEVEQFLYKRKGEISLLVGAAGGTDYQACGALP